MRKGEGEVFLFLFSSTMMKSPLRNEAFSHWARKMGSLGARLRLKRNGHPSTTEQGREGGDLTRVFFWGGRG